MAISIKDLPHSSEYNLLKEKNGRRERIKFYIDNTVIKYPATKDRITDFWNEHRGEYNNLHEADPETKFNQFFNKYDTEQDLINLIKPEVIKQIHELLQPNPLDSDMVKELKTIYDIKGHENLIPQFLNASKGGVSYLIFLIDLFKEYYLVKAPFYISKKLTDNGVELSELDKDKWTDLKGELFVNVYGNLNDDKEESDFGNTTNGINKAMGDIKDLIVETKKQKTIEEIQSSKDKATKLLNDLDNEKDSNRKILKTVDDLVSFIRNQKREYEIIDSPDSALSKITELLTNLKTEWGEHLDNTKEHYLLTLALNTEEKKERARQILEEVKTTNDNLEGYKKLERFWNGEQEKYNSKDNYDGKLYELRELLKLAEKSPKPPVEEKPTKHSNPSQPHYASDTESSKQKKK